MAARVKHHLHNMVLPTMPPQIPQYVISMITTTIIAIILLFLVWLPAQTEEEGEKTLDVGSAVSILKGEKKNLRRKEKRARIEQIRVTLGLSDSQRTPAPGETLRDFYRRTNMYWQMAAHEHTQHTGKELRKDGFDLAESRYKELKPILDELAILEAEQKAEEAEAPETSSRKRGNNKNKQRNPKR